MLLVSSNQKKREREKKQPYYKLSTYRIKGVFQKTTRYFFIK